MSLVGAAELSDPQLQPQAVQIGRPEGCRQLRPTVLRAASLYSAVEHYFRQPGGDGIMESSNVLELGRLQATIFRDRSPMKPASGKAS
jgi:hypothetical protein